MFLGPEGSCSRLFVIAYTISSSGWSGLVTREPRPMIFRTLMDEPKTTDRSAASPEPLSLAQAPPSGVTSVRASLQDNLKMEVPDGHGCFFFRRRWPAGGS